MGHGEKILGLDKILEQRIFAINCWDGIEIVAPLRYNKQGLKDRKRSNCFEDDSRKPGFYVGMYHVPKSCISSANLIKKQILIGRNYHGGLFD